MNRSCDDGKPVDSLAEVIAAKRAEIIAAAPELEWHYRTPRWWWRFAPVWVITRFS